MIDLRLHAPDPDEEFRQWLDEAAQEDESAIKFVILSWNTMRRWTVFELEEQRAILRHVKDEVSR